MKYTQKQYWNWLKENPRISTIEELRDKCGWFDGCDEEGIDGTYYFDGAPDEQFWVVVDKNGNIKGIWEYAPRRLEL